MGRGNEYDADFSPRHARITAKVIEVKLV